jgi:epoxyqueuosine reductase
MIAATMPSGTPAKEAIRARALSLGFDAVGFAAPELSAQARQELAAFIARGLHGDMGWLAANAERRADPKALWPEVRSAIVVGLNYGPGQDPMAAVQRRGRGAISVYARGRDYHRVIAKKLRVLARFIHESYAADVKLFVDTAPVMEKPLAAKTGVGWQGKHTNLVSRAFGSWLFLGEILTTLDFEPDEAERDHCGTCQACLDICPTRAFLGPYRLDARRCISYLTIEHEGHIAPEFRSLMGNRIYGCDDCLAVCPWNKYASGTRETEFVPRAELTAPRLAELARLDDAAFRKMFSGTAIKRTGRDRFVRNVLIALGNSGDARAAEIAGELLADGSALVRAMAVWALSRLTSPEEFAGFRARHEALEGDPCVRAEWLDGRAPAAK